MSKKAIEPLKHILKKTVNHIIVNKELQDEIFNVPFDAGALAAIRPKDIKNHDLLMFYESGEVVHTFFFNENGKHCSIPLANPVLIYFNVAQSTLRNIHTLRNELLGLFGPELKVNEKAMNLFFDFFGVASTFVIQLMTALEALVNQCIPDEYTYSKSDSGKCIKSYNKEQIQRWITLSEKISKVLYEITQSSFALSHPTKQVFINNLQELRDDIVHTKLGKGYEAYSDLYKKVLKFKYNETILAVLDFINFYKPNLIEPCTCGKDF